MVVERNINEKGGGGVGVHIMSYYLSCFAGTKVESAPLDDVTIPSIKPRGMYCTLVTLLIKKILF